MYHQLSFDDLERQRAIESEPTRYAFIDECGGFGFDFSQQGTSRFFVLCAVIIKAENLSSVSNAIDSIRHNYFSNSEMKSSGIGNNDKRRIKILTELLQLNFKIILLIADKTEFQKSALTDYRKSFYKYMHKILYNSLYLIYPKLKIYADEIGDEEFKQGFKNYVENNRPILNFLNEYDFDFVNSKDSNFVQIADIIAGSIARSLIDDSVPKYRDILSGIIEHTEFFPHHGLPNITNVSDKEKFDSDIYSLAYKLADDYITKNINSDDNEKRLKTGFLKILLFEVQNGSPFKYITSYQILNILNDYVDFKVTRDYLYRHIVASLRDDNIIIASSPQGYKLPVCIDDILTYVAQTNTIVAPMLHRIEICRNLIKSKTENKLDILDFDDYMKYKRYFD